MYGHIAFNLINFFSLFCLEPIGGECSPTPQAPTMSHSRVSPPLPPAVFLNQQTDSNHDTALTIACAGGHDDLVQLLLAKGSDIEHRDKKGNTLLLLMLTVLSCLKDFR